MIRYDDGYYRDILDGLSAYYDSLLIANLLTTINKVPTRGPDTGKVFALALIERLRGREKRDKVKVGPMR